MCLQTPEDGQSKEDFRKSLLGSDADVVLVLVLLEYPSTAQHVWHIISQILTRSFAVLLLRNELFSALQFFLCYFS